MGMRQTASAIAAITTLLTVSELTFATTWGKPERISDPLLKGAFCEVSKPMSSGSYIFQWPSKYDQVFWPLIDEHAIWMCSESGFAAFIEDFDLNEEEKSNLIQHLKAAYKPKSGRISLEDKLEQLQLSYALRNKDTEFNIQLLRVLAFYHENDLHNVKSATALRKSALGMIETELAGDLPYSLRLEYLFVSAAYYREFDEPTKSDAALSALRKALEENRDDKLKGYVEYLSELAGEIPKIAPGGNLAPQ